MDSRNLNDLTPEQLRAFQGWLANEEYGYFAEMAQSYIEDELARATRDPKPGENPDALSLDRERSLAKLQVHRTYSKLREYVTSLLPSAQQK